MWLDFLKILLTFAFVLFLPGFLLNLLLFGRGNAKMFFMERMVVIVPISVIAIDALVLLVSRLGVPITGSNLIILVTFWLLVLAALVKWRIAWGKKRDEFSVSMYDFTK